MPGPDIRAAAHTAASGAARRAAGLLPAASISADFQDDLRGHAALSLLPNSISHFTFSRSMLVCSRHMYSFPLNVFL